MKTEPKKNAAPIELHDASGAGSESSRREFLRAGATCLLGCAAGLAALSLPGCGKAASTETASASGGPNAVPGGPGMRGPGGPGRGMAPNPEVTLTAAKEGPKGTFTLPGAAGLKAGKALVFQAGAQPVVVFVNAAGKHEALSALCTHRGCAVDYKPTGTQRFQCPCHNSTFDENGKVLGGPATAPLPSYKIDLQGADAVVVIVS